MRSFGLNKRGLSPVRARHQESDSGVLKVDKVGFRGSVRLLHISQLWETSPAPVTYFGIQSDIRDWRLQTHECNLTSVKCRLMVMIKKTSELSKLSKGSSMFYVTCHPVYNWNSFSSCYWFKLQFVSNGIGVLYLRRFASKERFQQMSPNISETVKIYPNT